MLPYQILSASKSVSPEPVDSPGMLLGFMKALCRLVEEGFWSFQGLDFKYKFLSLTLLSRMKFAMNFLQAGAVHVGVNLGRRDIAMAQHGLNRPQIGAAF